MRSQNDTIFNILKIIGQMKNQELTNVNTEKNRKEFEVAQSVKILLQLQQENIYKRFPDLEESMGGYTVKIIVTY